MEWIPSLLKHLSISRSAVVAGFLTAIVLYLGPRVAPLYIDAVPAPWAVIVQAVLVFTGSLVFFWSASSLARSVSKNFRLLVQKYRARQLSEDEVMLLYGMGQNPREPLNLERVNFRDEDFPFSELELIKILDSLRNKGLVLKNPFASNLFSLTDRGRQKALDITNASEVEQDDEG